MGELVPSVSIAALVNARAGIVERFDKAAELLSEAAAMATNAGIATAGIGVGQTTYAHHCNEDIASERGRELYLQRLDRSAWEHLMTASGIRSFMDASEREKWEKQLRDGPVPELTAAAVEATFRDLYSRRSEFFDRGVISCFKSLSWDYKANQPFRFGKRIIVTYLVNGYGHKKANELDDLLRVLHILDGKPEPDSRRGMYSALSQARQSGGNEVDGEYLTVKFFKNGNGHVTFKRLDLVDRMNGIIAKHYPGALAAPREERKAA